MKPPPFQVAVFSVLPWLFVAHPAAQANAPRPHGEDSVRIRVSQPRLLTSEAPGVNHAEPWLAINPVDPSNMVAMAMTDSGGTVLYWSADGGAAWNRGTHSQGRAGALPGGDPFAIFDDEGTLFFATISPFRVWRSHDGGRTSVDPVRVPGRSFDREYLAIQHVTGGPDTLIAVAKTPIKIFGHMANDVLVLSRSADGGATFDAPRLFLPDPTHSITFVAGSPVATRDGVVLLPFIAHDAPVGDGVAVRNRIWLLRSANGGRAFDDPILVARSLSYGNNADEALMWKSISGARLVMDTSSVSPYRGRLYLSYVSAHAVRSQVMIVTSTDTGRTWTEPVVVNDDSGQSNHGNPEIAVNRQGTLAVVWNDRRHDPDDRCFRATVSASVDGGRTFLKNTTVALAGTCPLGDAASPVPIDSFRGRFLQGGETQGLVALPDGRFFSVFVSGETAMQLYSAFIEVPHPT